MLTFHSGGFCASPEGQAITPRNWAARVFRRLDAVIAVNRQIADFFADRCGVPVSRMQLISPHASVPDAGELPTGLRRFFDTHDPLLLSVGLLEPEYGLPLQIEALGRVRQSHPRAGLVMIGSGSQESGLRALIAAQPDAEHLLLTGDVPHAATLRAIRDCRVLLRTSHYDGDALSVHEALEMGTPVIATENGMRPRGCHLIPAPPRLEPLLERIETVLTPLAAAPPDHPGAAVGARNLDAVLELYQRLL